MESQPLRLEVIKGFHKERRFSEAVAQRLAISQRQSSAGVYESKWKVFGEWCQVKQINPVKATVQQLADFLIFLFEEKKLAISSIQGYRSCISKVFLARGIDICYDRDLNMLVNNFAIERPVQHRVAPRWDLMIVLRRLLRPPLEPMSMASAFSADVRFGQDYNASTLSFLPSFLAKTMDPSKPETDYAPVSIPALGPSMCEDLPDRFLCPDRALRYYLKLKHKGQYPNNRFRRLLCAFKLGHTGDISKQTVSGWIRQLIKQAYSEVQDEDIPHLTHTNFQARELRAFASSLAFPPKLIPDTGHGSGLLEKQQYICFILPKRPLPNGGYDYDGPFRSSPEDHATEMRATCCCWLLSHCFHCPEPGDTVSNGTHLSPRRDSADLERRRRYSTFRVSSL